MHIPLLERLISMEKMMIEDAETNHWNLAFYNSLKWLD